MQWHCYQNYLKFAKSKTTWIESLLNKNIISFNNLKEW